MTKEQLLAAGLSDEQATRILAALDSGYVPVSQHDAVVAELEQQKSIVKDRDAQLEKLKSESGNIDEVKKQITALQEENKAKEQSHASELKKIKIDSAIDMALVGAKAKNVKAARAMLDEFIAVADLDDKGNVVGLADAVDALVKDKSTSYLFDTQAQSVVFRGFLPQEGADGAVENMNPMGNPTDYATAIAKAQSATPRDAQNHYFQ